jgi:hypothetical protein
MPEEIKVVTVRTVLDPAITLELEEAERLRPRCPEWSSTTA